MTKEVENIKNEMIDEITKIIISNEELSHMTETMDFKYKLMLKADGSFKSELSKNTHGNPVFMRNEDDNILKSQSWHNFSLKLLAEILEKHQDE